MTTAHDVANYLINLSMDTGEPLTNMKLQKLIYYSYVWYMIETGKKLFDDPIVAWKYGPVIVAVYNKYKEFGADVIKDPKSGVPDALDKTAQEIIEEVFDLYGKMSGLALVNLSHSERPWQDAYTQDRENVLDDEIIKQYYSAKKARAEV